MGTKAGKLFIVVENTCKEEILFKDGLPDRSRLRQRKGIGISSIVKSVEKYGGDIAIRGRSKSKNTASTITAPMALRRNAIQNVPPNITSPFCLF